AVPNRVAGDVVAGQETLDTDDSVLGGGPDDLGFAHIGVEELDALALSDGVPGEGDVAALGRRHQYGLPGVVTLGAGLVAEGEEDGRVGAAAGLGQVEIS